MARDKVGQTTTFQPSVVVSYDTSYVISGSLPTLYSAVQGPPDAVENAAAKVAEFNERDALDWVVSVSSGATTSLMQFTMVSARFTSDRVLTLCIEQMMR